MRAGDLLTCREPGCEQAVHYRKRGPGAGCCEEHGRARYRAARRGEHVEQLPVSGPRAPEHVLEETRRLIAGADEMLVADARALARRIEEYDRQTTLVLQSHDRRVQQARGSFVETRAKLEHAVRDAEMAAAHAKTVREECARLGAIVGRADRTRRELEDRRRLRRAELVAQLGELRQLMLSRGNADVSRPDTEERTPDA